MTLLTIIFGRIKALFTKDALDRDMDKEMRLHVDLLAEEYERSGMPAEEARRKARLRFGNLPLIKERGRDVRGAGIFEDVLRDVKHALRGFLRSPGFTASVVLMLALGIGANTAIFSIVDRLLLRALPYPDGDQVVMVYESFPNNARSNVSPANWIEWQRMSQSFEFLSAYNSNTTTLTGDGEPEQVAGQLVSAEFFPGMKVQALRGRLFTAEDMHPKAPRVVVLSHRFWQRRFGGDEKIIGKSIELDFDRYEVIGIMPSDFYFINQLNDYWVPYLVDRTRDWRAFGGRIMLVAGRLKPSVSVEAAQAEMSGIARQLEQTYPAFNKNGVNVVPLREVLTGQVRASLLVLYAAVAVLLLIACFNVAGLLLARTASRRREFAVRTSLGAGQGAIVRQLLVESLLLACAGGLAGYFVAFWGVRTLIELTPRNLIRVVDIPADRWLLLYTFAVSMFTGFLFGLAPAIAATRGGAAEYLRGAGRAIHRSARLRQGLLTAQVTMTVILLCCAGLLVRSFAALNGIRTGVDAGKVLTMQANLPESRYNRNQHIQFLREAVERLEALPGVEAAGIARSIPVIGGTSGTGIHLFETPDVPMFERPTTRIRIATPGYFKALGIPVIRGRDFTWDDLAENAPPVFIVNEAFVRTHLKGWDPLNVTMKVFMAGENPYSRIAGVVADVNEGSLRAEAAPTVFYNFRYQWFPAVTLFIRSEDPARLAQPAMRVIRELDPNQALPQTRTLQEALGISIARERLNATVSAAFALSALLLASLGLYSLLSFSVAERSREIGIRMALGAEASGVLRMVMNHGLRLVVVGTLIGVAGAFGISRLLISLLFGITPHDPVTFAAVMVLLAAVSALAAFIPARRATKVDPVVALRMD